MIDDSYFSTAVGILQRKPLSCDLTQKNQAEYGGIYKSLVTGYTVPTISRLGDPSAAGKEGQLWSLSE